MGGDPDSSRLILWNAIRRPVQLEIEGSRQPGFVDHDSPR